FLQAVEPSDVKVQADGKAGGPAIIRVTGGGGDFLSLAKGVNSTLMPSVPLVYTVDYVLEPGKQYVKIVVTINNPTDSDALFNLSIPFGFITLLGEGQHLFVPGKAGFDMRFRIDQIYADYA